MPRGVYPRTQNQLKASVANLAKGREPEARAKAARTLKKIAESKEWRKKVSAGTKKAMHRPEVRSRHLRGLARALKKHGVNFKGGKNQEPTDLMKKMTPLLAPFGFVPEYKINMKGFTVKWKTPSCYQVDFGHPKLKIAIELDGICHRSSVQKAKDKKKTTILEALGWTVIRIAHD